MSISSGSIVGNIESTPYAKLIINNNNYNLNMCLNRTLNLGEIPVSGEKRLLYNCLVPENVGCNLDIVDGMSFPTISLWGLNASNNEWTQIVNTDDITVITVYNNSIGNIGCFKRFNFGVAILGITGLANSIYCDLILCMSGTFNTGSCKPIEGCENFCIKITKTD